MNIPGRRRNLVVLKSRHFKAKKDNAPVVEQLKLAMYLGMRRELAEMEESIAVALSKGARVEPCIHKAELVPERRARADGGLRMKLVIILFLFAIFASAAKQRSVFVDLNGDGKVDAVDVILALTGVGAAMGAATVASRSAKIGGIAHA